MNYRRTGPSTEPGTKPGTNPARAPQRWRRRWYLALEPAGDGDDANADAAGATGWRIRSCILVEMALAAVILVNAASLILITVPGLAAAYTVWFHLVEYCAVSVFIAEYLLRLWVAPEANPDAAPWRQRWRYMRSPAALVDMAALVPSAAAALVLLVEGSGANLTFLLTVRLLTRSAKLARYFPPGRRLAYGLRRKASQLLTTVACLIIVLIIAASLMYFAESAAQPEVFSSIPAAMWWSVVTLTTVGYGDTVPVTGVGRALAAVIAVLGIGLFALPAGILSAGLLEAENRDTASPQLGTGPSAEAGDAAKSGAGDANYCPHCGQPMPARAEPAVAAPD